MPRRLPRELGGDRLQQLVAGAVPVGVVDLLEGVEVEHEQRGLLAVAPAARDLHRELALEQAAVVQAGERVVLGEVAQALLHHLALGDVLDLGDEVQRAALAVAYERDGEHRRDDVPAGVEVAALHLVVADLSGEQLADVLDVGGEVVGVGDVLERLGEQLLGGVAGDREQRLVDADPAARGCEQRHSDRGLLEDELEALLGVAASFLGVLAGGDVARDDDAADGRAVLTAQRPDLDLVAAGVVGRPDLQRAGLAVQRGAVERLVGLPALADEDLDGGPPLEVAGTQPFLLERRARRR